MGTIGLLQIILSADNLVEGWECTDCAWTYPLKTPVRLRDAGAHWESANAAFHRHDCATWPRASEEDAAAD